MGDRNTEEKQSIRDYAKPLKKYGSTCNHIKRQDHFVTHAILESDTLQGIALKYGVTMEQIRRANRLWASDSLFLRESLMIPVAKDNAISPNIEEFVGQLPSPSAHVNGTDKAERSIDDFLGKIDSSIAITKSQVKKSQGNSEFCEEDELFVRKKPPISRLRQQVLSQSQVAVAADPLSAPHPVVMTQGRKVRTSLQRLEKEQDEMFEL